MLLGIPLLAASTVHEAWSGSSIAAAPVDFDTAVESGVESVEEEDREEESKSKTHLSAEAAFGAPLACRCQGFLGWGSSPRLPGCRACIVAIRGPPAAL